MTASYAFKRKTYLLKVPLIIVFCFCTVTVFAFTDDDDILERRDVQSILFGQSSAYSHYLRDRVFRAELVGDAESIRVGAYYLRRLYAFVKSQWGAEYKGVGKDHSFDLQALVLLSWDRYFIQPFAGVGAGLELFPKKNRSIFSHSLLGADLQLTKDFGISAREVWDFPNSPIRLGQPVNLKFENAIFELVFYWQI